ncbi:hypothetical protein Tco_0103686, partial [Tanacetum coccineum]
SRTFKTTESPSERVKVLHHDPFKIEEFERILKEQTSDITSLLLKGFEFLMVKLMHYIDLEAILLFESLFFNINYDEQNDMVKIG